MAKLIRAGAFPIAFSPRLGHQTAAVRRVSRLLERYGRELDRAWRGEDAEQVKRMVTEMTDRCKRLEMRLDDLEKVMAGSGEPGTV